MEQNNHGLSMSPHVSEESDNNSPEEETNLVEAIPWQEHPIKQLLDSIYTSLPAIKHGFEGHFESANIEMNELALKCENQTSLLWFFESYHAIASKHLEEEMGVWACVECGKLIPVDLEMHQPCDGEER
jgi:rubrerythrin